ncbi:hypothetical protein PR048_013263 [Dryococelus australis]|uniref:DDE Tnp4 domain-containing protein n=1 Tax=Dryococelus australis TaxID=614101 RepID=A0ABQ9HT77_9NEOP|nr:hypothetical protein PR048_013263 [Dryococelus australis]
MLINLQEIVDIGHRLFHPTDQSHALSPRMHLSIILHWFGNGGQYHVIAYENGVSKVSLYRCVKNVLQAIDKIKFTEIVAWSRKIVNVYGVFFCSGKISSFIGCVDGTLVKIDAPTENEPAFVDRNGNHSINSRIVCGPDLEIYYVSTNWPRSVHDARVLASDRKRNHPLLEWLITPVNDILGNTLGILKEKLPFLSHFCLSPIDAYNVFNGRASLYNFSWEKENVNARVEED